MGNRSKILAIRSAGTSSRMYAPISRFSSTLRPVKMFADCGTYPTP
jgi:hypothetical protein